MHLVDLKKWQVLSRPQRDTTQRIPLCSLNESEYKHMIDIHKQYVTLTDIELALELISGDLKHKISILQDILKEDREIEIRYYEELF
jgi:hypothetical protein